MLLSLAGCATHASKPVPALDDTLVKKIDAQMQRELRERKIPGLAIGIVKDGQAVYSKGFGVTDIRTGQPVTDTTIFQLGSDSKMMVGIAMMQLQQQGKIDLDAPVTRYLPYFKLADRRYKQITLREILSHRSGMPYCITEDECNYLDYQTPQYDAGAPERHVRRMAPLKLVAKPGQKMQYSDLGFETIGVIISKVSGQSFESYIHDHIFSPLGMKHSSFLLSDIPPASLASPHEVDETTTVSPDFPYSRQHAPSSHLFSNVQDMNRFAMAQLNRGRLGDVEILPASAYDVMWHPEIATTLYSPWEKTLGLGWFLGEDKGHRLVGHGGGDTGFSCGVVMAPDDGMAVIVMINRLESAEDVAFTVMDMLLKAKADKLQAETNTLPR